MGASTNKASGSAAGGAIERPYERACNRGIVASWVRRVAGAASLGALLGAVTGCQGPGGMSPFHYGGGADCAMDVGPKPVSLEVSLDPLRDEFDRYADVPRVVALMPHMGCERGAEILREQVLDAYPTSDLRLLVIWQDIARTEGAAAAASRATLSLMDERVTAFHDCSGLAGRAFARGNLPVAEAREVFLFYPAGKTWPRSVASGSEEPLQSVQGSASADRPRTETGFNSSFRTVGDAARPDGVRRHGSRQGAGARKTSGVTDITPWTDSWVHQLGRVAPEKFCTPQELPGEMRQAVQRLLAQAETRRQRLARR